MYKQILMKALADLPSSSNQEFIRKIRIIRYLKNKNEKTTHILIPFEKTAKQIGIVDSNIHERIFS
jgi:hypothetical protein